MSRKILSHLTLKSTLDNPRCIMKDCLFCKILSGEIPGTPVYQDDDVYIFNDLNPQAPVHILAIPKKHIASTNEITEHDDKLIGKIFLRLKEVAKGYEELKGSYRIVSNCGAESGQSVFHLHYHLLGGRPMGWPPG